MLGDTISIRPVNVELTEEKRLYALRQLTPLLRLVNSDTTPTADIALRLIKRPLSGNTYCIMVRVATSHGPLHAVAMSRSYYKSVRDVRDELRKIMSRSHKLDLASVAYLQEKAHERYFVELFV